METTLEEPNGRLPMPRWQRHRPRFSPFPYSKGNKRGRSRFKVTVPLISARIRRLAAADHPVGAELVRHHPERLDPERLVERHVDPPAGRERLELLLRLADRRVVDRDRN